MGIIAAMWTLALRGGNIKQKAQLVVILAVPGRRRDLLKRDGKNTRYLRASRVDQNATVALGGEGLMNPGIRLIGRRIRMLRRWLRL